MPRGRRPATEREPPGPEQALELAGHFLGTRPRTRWEVAQRLRRAKASDEVIATTLARLEELALVGDLAFARWWLEQRDRHAPRGRRLLEAELRQHGVPREVIEELRDELATPERGAGSEVLPGNDQERATAALQQHLHGRPVPDDPKALQRLGMYLVRRGFDAEVVRATLRATPPGSLAEDLRSERP